MYSMLQQSRHFAAPESRSVFGQCGHVIGENGARRNRRYRLTWIIHQGFETVAPQRGGCTVFRGVGDALVTGLNGPEGIAVSGSDLFVVNGGGKTIGEYDATTGATVNAALVTWGVEHPKFHCHRSRPGRRPRAFYPHPSRRRSCGTGMAPAQAHSLII
jgi:hypothetical protein